MMVSTDRDALVSEIHIAAEPERVFQALIDPAQVPQWWGQKDVYRCETYEADLRVGGEWRMAGVGGDQPAGQVARPMAIGLKGIR